MLGNAPLWEVTLLCHSKLDEVGAPHAVCGGVAVCLHGYQRNTVDVDWIVRREDAAAIRETLESAGMTWQSQQAEFRSPAGVAVQLLFAGDRAGDGGEVRLPDPAQPVVTTSIEGLPVLSLSRLIETKLASGEGNLRRTHKDFADVVELIAVHQLDGSFARFIHRSLRRTYRELARRAQG